MTDQQYWTVDNQSQASFPGIAPEHRAYLNAALELGYRPYVFAFDNIGAEFMGRGAIILRRGPRRWEVLLGDSKTTVDTPFVDSFPEAARRALSWLSQPEPGPQEEPNQRGSAPW